MVLTPHYARSIRDQYATAVTKNSFDGEYTADSIIATLSVGIAFYNSLEMVLLMLSTFKKWKGLYFWSLWICNFGVMLYALGMCLSYFNLCVLWLSKVILDIGWVAMVSFQSLVLYSRLGLIVNNLKLLKTVKWLIIVNSIVLCTAVVILDFGTTYSPLPAFAKGYYYIEQIQMTLFTVQELFISSLYVWKTLALLKVLSSANARSVIWQLLTINIVIISMDIGLVTLQFLHHQLYQEALKGFAYSVKLKLELNILSKLVDFVQGNNRRRSMALDIVDSSTIAGQTQTSIEHEATEFRNVDGLFVSEKKGASGNTEEILTPGHRSSVSFALPTPSNQDPISRLTSNQTINTARTSGRESDILYAEMLRSMK